MGRRGWKRAGAVAAAAVALGASGYLLAAVASEGRGEPAPDVAVELLDGRVLSLSELRGRVVLVNFWATWCPPCRLEMPGFQRIYEARSDDGFVIVGLSTDMVPDEQIAFFLEQQGIGYPVGRATAYAARSFGGASTLPMSVLIDADGRIRNTVTGVYDEATLLADVDRLLLEAGLEPTGEVAARPAETLPLDLDGVGHAIGETAAPVTVVEFSDYGCAYCGRFALASFPTLYEEFVATGRVRWIHVPFVLGKFPNSAQAARAAACAGEQGDAAYWGLHFALFRRQPEWRAAADPVPVFRSYLEDAGADGEAFAACYGGDGPDAGLRKAERAAYAAGVGATPTFFVDGRRVEGAVPLPEFRAALEAAALR
jgi:protein-disulfide isomerase/thiol-disulfide isomerase/thioredoxin